MNKNNPNKKNKYLPLVLLFTMALSVACYNFYRSFYKNNERPKVTYKLLEKYLKRNEVDRIVMIGNKLYVKVYIKEERIQANHKDLFDYMNGRYDAKKAYYTMQIDNTYTFYVEYKEMLQRQNKIPKVGYEVENEYNRFSGILDWLSSIFFILLLLFLLFGRSVMQSGPEGRLFGILKSKAVLWGKDRKVNVTLKDVAGMDEEKEEIEEIIEFLKNPDKAKRLGGRIPKGVLLSGLPGTGKTLLAKAVSGEAEVPFFSVSGSDFAELYVGVGVSRVENLFQEARKNAPCIIFIDEIDAIGGARNNRRISNQEQENTLNKLLAELDGFGSQDDIILIGATNRPDVLDSALLRPGRFDRHIKIDLPGIEGRVKIFTYHIQEKALKVASKISFKQLATQTPGFSGADIANTCNEAALLAARKEKNKIEMSDFQEAMDRVSIGLEKKSKVISPKEKEIVAWHEAGHAVVAWFLEHASPLVKVSIIPRGPAALGYAQYLPKEQAIYQEQQLKDRICTLMAGRAAEELMFKQKSTGAADDFKKSTALAYNMVRKYGMNNEIGYLSFEDNPEFYSPKPYSDAMGERIDMAVQEMVKEQYNRAKETLEAHYDVFKAVAEALIKKEVLLTKDMVKIAGKRPFQKEKTKKTKPAKKVK